MGVENCIAIQFLYCRLRLAWESENVLQYSLSYCKRKVGWMELYHNTIYCIVTAGAVGYWTVSRHKAATRPARPRHGAGGRAAGERGAR